MPSEKDGAPGYPQYNQGYSGPPGGGPQYGPPGGGPQYGPPGGAPQGGYYTSPPPGQPPYYQPGVADPHNVVVVTQPGPTTAVVYGQRPTDLTIPAVLVCLCCCFIPGIIAIVYACNARKAADDGDFAGAESNNKSAKIAIIVAIVLGVCWIILTIVLRVVVYSTTNVYYYYG